MAIFLTISVSLFVNIGLSSVENYRGRVLRVQHKMTYPTL